MTRTYAATLVAVVIGAGIAVRAQAQAPAPAATAHPSVHVVQLPDFWGEYAIWGSTGADARGRIWLGITSNDDDSGSAHLFRYDPVTETVVDRGNVVGELQRLGLRRPGEKQMKIHSRIVQMPDGYLYFASMDESGEVDDGSKLPTWGGHLWRLGPSGKWEHLARAPEALLAVAGGGPYVYALGYFNNVLYQYDTRTAKVAHKTVGNFGGHVTRNFFADDRGHVYVPRVSADDATEPHTAFSAELIEFDGALKQVASHPLPEYLDAAPADSHGIVAINPDGTGGWYFASGKGRLYHLERKADAPSEVTDLGWFHPEGPRYTAAMFRDPATGTLYGASTPSANGGPVIDWITRAADGTATTTSLPYGDVPFPRALTVYGSMTRDANGRFYVVGSMNYKPVVLQITP